MANYESIVGIIMISLIGYLIYLGNNWKIYFQEKNMSSIQVLILLITLWSFPIAIQYAIEIATINTATANIITLLETLYFADMMLNIALTTFVCVYAIYTLFLTMMPKRDDN